jgi:hypothetical protein
MQPNGRRSSRYADGNFRDAEGEARVGRDWLDPDGGNEQARPRSQ